MKKVMALLVALGGIGSVSYADRPSSRTAPVVPATNTGGISFGTVRDLTKCKSFVVNISPTVAAEGLLDIGEVESRMQSSRDMNERGQLRRRAIEQCVTCDYIDIESGDSPEQKLRCLKEQADRLATIKSKKLYGGLHSFYSALLLNTIEINALDKTYDPDYRSYERAFRSETQVPFYNIDGRGGYQSFSTQPDSTLWFKEPYRTLILFEHVMFHRKGAFTKYFSTLPESQRRLVEEGMLKGMFQGWAYGDEVVRNLGESKTFQSAIKENYEAVGRALDVSGAFLGGSLWVLRAYSEETLERIKSSIRAEENLQEMRMKIVKGEGGLQVSVETLEGLGTQRGKVEELLRMAAQAGQLSQQSMLQHLNRIIISIALENDLALSNHLKRMMALVAYSDVDGAVLILKPLLWSGQGRQFAQTAAQVIKQLPYAVRRDDAYSMLKRDLPELRTYQGRIETLLRAVDDVELNDTIDVDKTVESLIGVLNENMEYISMELRGNLLSELTNSLFQDTEDRLLVLHKVKKSYRTNLEQLLTDIRLGMKEMSKLEEAYKTQPSMLLGPMPVPPISGRR